METQVSVRERNRAIIDYLGSPGLEKKGADSVNSFTRRKMREDSFARKIVPPVSIQDDEFDRVPDTDNPTKVIDLEPDSPAAVSVPFNDLPDNVYIQAPRYVVRFDRILSPRFTKDLMQLRTYHMDVRQLLADIAIKDMLAEEDTKFLRAVNNCLGSINSTQALTGAIQYKGFSDGITRNATVEAKKIMDQTPYRLAAEVALTNMVTIKEMEKWGRDEMGGDFSEDLVRRGWSEETFEGLKWVVTIKRDLVGDNTIYYFANPKFIGKSFMIEDTTMYVKVEAYMLDYFMYNCLGGAIGNAAGVARADFNV